jgi:hypothetical protein
MSAKLIFGPRSRCRLYAVRRLKVVQGALARGPFLGIYQATSGEAAVRGARRDFPAYSREVLAAIDQIASLLVLGGEALVFPATIQFPDGTCRKALLNHDEPDQAFRRISVDHDDATGALRFATESRS